MKNKKIGSYIMAIIGFIMILINAAGYLFNLEIKSPILTLLGLVFIVIGMKNIKDNQ